MMMTRFLFVLGVCAAVGLGIAPAAAAPQEAPKPPQPSNQPSQARLKVFLDCDDCLPASAPFRT
jgi:hypothetical protein